MAKKVTAAPTPTAALSRNDFRILFLIRRPLRTRPHHVPDQPEKRSNRTNGVPTNWAATLGIAPHVQLHGRNYGENVSQHSDP
jgi:hypothetical protein